MCYPGVVHKPMTVQDELTSSQRAPNERVLFRTHPSLQKKKKKVWRTSLAYDPPSLTQHPPSTVPSLRCRIDSASESYPHTCTQKDSVLFICSIQETNGSIRVWHQLIGVNWSTEVTETCPDKRFKHIKQFHQILIASTIFLVYSFLP